MTAVRWIVVGLLAMLLLLVAAHGFASRGPSSFEAQFRTQAADALAVASAPSGVISDAEVDALPAPVAEYVAAGRSANLTYAASMPRSMAASAAAQVTRGCRTRFASSTPTVRIRTGSS